MSRDTLNYEDVVALIGPPPHGHKHLVTHQEFEAELQEEAAASAPPPPAADGPPAGEGAGRDDASQQRTGEGGKGAARTD